MVHFGHNARVGDFVLINLTQKVIFCEKASTLTRLGTSSESSQRGVLDTLYRVCDYSAIAPHHPPGLVGFFIRSDMPLLNTCVIIDYQNLHMTGKQLFNNQNPIHLSLIDPLKYSNQLISKRNSLQEPGKALATLTKILVYRGLPSPKEDKKSYGRSLAQKSEWERDRRVNVIYRPLKYYYKRDTSGSILLDSNGKSIIDKVEEKGIDVLCALAIVREARDANNQLVIVASQDTDLIPALNEAIVQNGAKIETCSWFSGNASWSHEIRPEKRKIWNTRLDGTNFSRSLDTKAY